MLKHMHTHTYALTRAPPQYIKSPISTLCVLLCSQRTNTCTCSRPLHPTLILPSTSNHPSARCAWARLPRWRRCCWPRAPLASAAACRTRASWCTSPSAAHRWARVCWHAFLGTTSSVRRVAACLQPSFQAPLHSHVTKHARTHTNSHHQGQASDILIQAKEIERLRDMLIGLYERHTHKDYDTISEWAGRGREAGC